MITRGTIRQQLVRSERCANIFPKTTNVYCVSILCLAVGQTLGTWRRTKLLLELWVVPLNTTLVLDAKGQGVGGGGFSPMAGLSASCSPRNASLSVVRGPAISKHRLCGVLDEM